VGLDPPEYRAHTGVSQYSSGQPAADVRIVKPDIMSLDSLGVQTVIDICGASEQKNKHLGIYTDQNKSISKTSLKKRINKSIKLRY